MFTALALWLDKVGVSTRSRPHPEYRFQTKAMLTVVLVPRWQPRFYHFTPQGLNTIVQETLSSQSALQNLPIENLNTTILLTDLLERIKVAYPDTQVQTDFLDRDEWVWNNAGGAMGSMYIIHASITE